MKLKRLAAITASTALLAGGIALAVPLAASAHTAGETATCAVFDAHGGNYAAPQAGKDAVYHDWSETVVDTPAVAEVPGKPAVPAVTHLEYEFKQIITGKIKTNPDRWWNPGFGWFFDGNTVTIVDTPEVPAVAAIPAIPAVTHSVPHHDLVSGAVEAKTNHVTVWINGAVVSDHDFGTSYSESQTFANKFVANDWRIKVTAWDSENYSFDHSGTTTACEIPVVNANPHAAIVAVCGQADIDLTNPQGEYEQNKTAAFTIWVDGKFKEAVVVTGGATEHRTYTFAEDSGDHHVVVKNAESAGGGVLAEATVSSDCILPQPEAKVVTSDWTDGKFGCTDTTVEQTRTVTTTPYVLVEGEWVLDNEHAVVATEHQTRDLTAAEIKALDCPVVVVVPPAQPPTVTVTVPAPAPAPIVNTSDVLAHTGSDTSFAAWLIAAGLALSGAILSIGAYAHRRRQQN